MERLKYLRLSKKFTQGELALKLGVARTTVTMWEKGDSKPRFNTLVQLAKILGCSIDELFNTK